MSLTSYRSNASLPLRQCDVVCDCGNHSFVSTAQHPMTATTVTPSTTVSSVDRDRNRPQSHKMRFPDTLSGLIAGVAQVNRSEFAELYDVGVPWKASEPGNAAVLLMYSAQSSLPDGHPGSGVPAYQAKDATKNCNSMKVILTDPNESHRCLAIVGQWESYNAYKFQRLALKSDGPAKPAATHPMQRTNESTLQLVGAWENNDKRPAMLPPSGYHRDRGSKLFVDYWSKRRATLSRLRPVAAKAANKHNNTVVVMITNWGQSSLLHNFVCSARSNHIDLSSVVLFGTDNSTVELGRSLGLNVFDVQDAFGGLPTKSAETYGDPDYAVMMTAKVYCVHLVNKLGHNVLFQDVDVTWHKNPLPFFFRSEEAAVASHDVDLYFQDDGSRSDRFAPFSANTGFYYVRHNDKTEHLFSALLKSIDLILENASHQAVLIALLNEHTSRYGLRVKVLGVDTALGMLFPGGFHYHRRPALLKRIATGSHENYIFHMSWNVNMEIKRKFLEQMGYWFVDPSCHYGTGGWPSATSRSNSTDRTAATDSPLLLLPENCCVSDPLPKCHFRDKPSKSSCEGSPSLVPGKASFW